MIGKGVAGLSKLEINSVYQGDCLKLMKDIPDGSIDMILADLPYGTTACKWDTIIPFEPLWEQYERIIKPNGAIVLTASQPFTSALVMSNPKMFRYSWVWEKQQGTNPLLSKKQPMKVHEDIVVFYDKQCLYNPQMTQGTPYSGFITGKSKTTGDVMGNAKSIHRDNPSGTRYPRSVQKFNTPRIKGGHPTQKPVALFEYLIKTYTNEGDLVLDNVAGSGTTGVSCQNLNRNFILMEQDPEYVEVIKKRLELNKERRNDQH